MIAHNQSELHEVPLTPHRAHRFHARTEFSQEQKMLALTIGARRV